MVGIFCHTAHFGLLEDRVEEILMVTNLRSAVGLSDMYVNDEERHSAKILNPD